MANKKYDRFTNEPLNEEELAGLSQPPHEAIERLWHGKGNATDWYNTAFRILFGCKVAEKVYTQETAREFDACWDLIEVIRERHKTNFEENWCILQSEYQTLKRGLEGIDELCRDTDRHTMIYAAHKTKARLIHFVNRYKKAEAEYDAQQAALAKRKPT